MIKSIIKEVMVFIICMAVAWFFIHEVMGWSIWCATYPEGVWCVAHRGGTPW